MTQYCIYFADHSELFTHLVILYFRYLATGDQVHSIASSYRVGESTVVQVINEVCDVIHKVLGPIYMRAPNSTQEWEEISRDFLLEWNFPLCLGACDGKHVRLQAPDNSGSIHYNYKKYFSMTLLAVCDARYNFTLYHVGEPGSNSDSGIFLNSRLGFQIVTRQLNIPRGVANLPGSDIQMKSFFVGDDAFPLSDVMMKPYTGTNLSNEQKIFNYRLSRTRRVIENSFGILVSRWRVLSRPIAFNVHTVDKIVLATMTLHNYLNKTEDSLPANERTYCPPNFVDREDRYGNIIQGQWRGACQQNVFADDNNVVGTAEEGKNIRNILKSYFLTPEGQVPWQNAYIKSRFE